EAARGGAHARGQDARVHRGAAGERAAPAGAASLAEPRAGGDGRGRGGQRQPGPPDRGGRPAGAGRRRVAGRDLLPGVAGRRAGAHPGRDAVLGAAGAGWGRGGALTLPHPAAEDGRERAPARGGPGDTGAMPVTRAAAIAALLALGCGGGGDGGTALEGIFRTAPRTPNLGHGSAVVWPSVRCGPHSPSL